MKRYRVEFDRGFCIETEVIEAESLAKAKFFAEWMACTGPGVRVVSVTEESND